MTTDSGSADTATEFRGNARPAAMAAGELRDMLESRGLTLTAAAGRLGFSKSTIHRWLAGSTPITERTVLLIRARIDRT